MTCEDVKHAIERYVDARPHLFIACEDRKERTWVRKAVEYEAMALEFPELHRMYVHKADDSGEWRPIPALKNIRPIRKLEPLLMDHYGQGQYRVLIKWGRSIVHKNILFIGRGAV